MLYCRILALACLLLISFQPTPASAAIKQRMVSIETKAGDLLSGGLFSPEQTGPVPGVLVLHTAGGLSDAERIYARRMAEAGFAALIVSYPVGWIASTNEALAETVDWLRQQPESLNMPIGVVGFSLGASKALLAAALRPKTVKAVISYYGTYNVGISKFGPRVKQASVKTKQPVPSPVETAGRIEAAILLLQGENDDETDPQQTAQMQSLLTRTGKTFEIKIYPGAVHMFEREARFHPPGFRTSFGTVTGYNEAAATDSWEKSIAWLKQHLRSAAN